MGKTKQTDASNSQTYASSSQPDKSKTAGPHPNKDKKPETRRSTQMLKEYLPAANLTAKQKRKVKKACQKLYNYKHPKNRVTKIETATEQLEQMMQAKALQLKLGTKQRPHK